MAEDKREEPAFVLKDTASPYCNSLPQRFVQVPQIFDKPTGFRDVEIPSHSYQARDFGYTVSLWLKNFGGHEFSTDPR